MLGGGGLAEMTGGMQQSTVLGTGMHEKLGHGETEQSAGGIEELTHNNNHGSNEAHKNELGWL